MKFTTQFKKSSQPYSIVEGVSMTVPDDAMSLKTMLLQFSRGMTPAISQQGHYTSDEVDNVEFDHAYDNSYDLSDVTTNAMQIDALKEVVEAERNEEDKRRANNEVNEAKTT